MNCFASFLFVFVIDFVLQSGFGFQCSRASQPVRNEVKKKEISFALHSLRANVLVFHFFLLTTYDLNAY